MSSGPLIATEPPLPMPLTEPGDARRRARLVDRRGAGLVLGVIGILLCAGLLEGVVRIGYIKERDMPLVSEVIPRLVSNLHDGNFWSMVADTLTQAGIGLVIAIAIAVPAGLAIGSIEILWRALRPTIEFLRPVPSVALLPLIQLLYGSTTKSAVVLIGFVCTWPLLISAIYGVREVDSVARDAARAFGLGPVRRAFRLVLPSALPFLVTGVRIASSAAVIVAITVEMFISSPGLGAEIVRALDAGNTVGLYALIVAAGILGLVVNLVLARLERHYLRWAPSQRALEA